MQPWLLLVSSACMVGAPSASTDSRSTPPPKPPAHIKHMTAFGYDAAQQAGWCTFGKSFNLSALVEGHAKHGIPGLYRIDCVGCQSIENGVGKWPKDPGFAAGVVCDRYAPGCGDATNRTQCPEIYHMCQKSRGDATNWDEQTLFLLNLAKPHLISGVLHGVYLGDELSASGHGDHPAPPQGWPAGFWPLDFNDLEKWIDLVRGFLDALAPARTAAGVTAPLELYYTSSDYCGSWPYIPRNLTLFSLDDYHPSWMYPSSSKCLAGGWPRPAGCQNETTGLWVYPQVNKDIFEPGRLGPNTKVLLVPPTWGSHHPCTSGPPSVWCTNQTYAEWLELNHGNFSFYTRE